MKAFKIEDFEAPETKHSKLEVSMQAKIKDFCGCETEFHKHRNKKFRKFPRVIGFTGSPRIGGNTETLVEEMLKGASDAGAETKIFSLSKMIIAPCEACQHCKGNEGGCATDDDMQDIYEELKEADAFILGSPVYMWQMSAQAKLFTDRLYAFYMTGFEEKYGKKDMALVFSQGNPDENLFAEYFDYTRNMFEFIGYNVIDVLASKNNTIPEAVKGKEDDLEKAREIGKKLVEG